MVQNMAPIMFGSLVVFLLLGYPAAFSLGAVGLIFALIGIERGVGSKPQRKTRNHRHEAASLVRRGLAS